jgi:hypothetical protein
MLFFHPIKQGGAGGRGYFAFHEPGQAEKVEQIVNTQKPLFG